MSESIIKIRIEDDGTAQKSGSAQPSAGNAAQAASAPRQRPAPVAGPSAVPPPLPRAAQAKAKADAIGIAQQVAGMAGQGKIASIIGTAASAGVGGGTLAALGPYAAIAAGAKMTIDTMTKSMNKATDGYERAARVTSSIIGNRPMAAWMDIHEGVANTLEEIPILGSMYAAQMRLAIAPLKATVEVVNAINTRAREVARYDGRIASAAARADVRNTLADIGEAQRLGGQYARVIESTSKIEHTLRELLMPIKEFIVTAAAHDLERIVEMLRVLKTSVDILHIMGESGFKAMVEAVNFNFDDAKKVIREGDQKIKEALEQKEKKPDKDLVKAYFEEANIARRGQD